MQCETHLYCVFVAAPPSIQQQSHTIYVRARKSALFPCDFTGFPIPSVYWTVIHPTSSINVTQGSPKSLYLFVGEENYKQDLTVYQNGALNISEVRDGDSAGQYQCTAVNLLGVAKSSVKLQVVGGRNALQFCNLLVRVFFLCYLSKSLCSFALRARRILTIQTIYFLHDHCHVFLIPLYWK